MSRRTRASPLSLLGPGDTIVISAATAPPEPPACLTDAEAAVFLLLCEGHGDEAIAARRGRARTTIAKQVRAILEKLGASDRIELMLRARRADAPP